MTTTARSLALLAALAVCLPFAAAQDSPSSAPVLIRHLTLTATDHPGLDLAPIAAALQDQVLPLPDLAGRIQQKLRDDGYYFAHAGTPQLAEEHREPGRGRSADVTLPVETGDRYSTGQITFRGATQFKPDELRAAFPLTPGAVFNASAVNTGIDRLKHLYETQGYADIGAVPSIVLDDQNHVADLSIEIEEGSPYIFGELTVDGVEPAPGTTRALLAAWKSIAGQRYSPAVLEKWLAANTPKAPRGAPIPHPRAEGLADPPSHRMNVHLTY